MAEVRVESVGLDVPTTDTRAVLPDHPENLSFDE